MEKNRLSKILASAGVASRRACEKLIFDGKVTVNGRIILKPETHVSLETDDIRVDDIKISEAEKKIYYILNKPRGYICSNFEVGRKKLVIDLFPPEQRVFTVGRLDRDTTGLLIVTNDGHFAQTIIHPRANIEKEYLVKTVQEIEAHHLKDISFGSFVDGAFVRPIRVSKVRKGTLKVVVKEGRKREVRLFVEKSGLEIISLARIRIGGLSLGNIPEGTFREMDEAEKEALLQK